MQPLLSSAIFTHLHNWGCNCLTTKLLPFCKFEFMFVIILAAGRPSPTEGNSISNMRNIFSYIVETALGI